MPRGLIVPLLFALTSLALAQKDDLAELQHKADTSGGAACAHFSLLYAQQLVEASDKLYTDGNVDEAVKLVHRAGDYAERGTECALLVHRRQKDTEIDLREMARRLGDIERSLTSDDRPPLEQEIARADKLRDKLLDQMFGGKNGQHPRPTK